MVIKFMLAFVFILTPLTANAQKYNNPRPQFPGYYNGHGVTRGYSYNPRSGWNTLTTPSGASIHYRDGYVPLRQSYRRRYNQSYNNGTYADMLGEFIFP